jgi:hypothetical protein
MIRQDAPGVDFCGVLLTGIEEFLLALCEAIQTLADNLRVFEARSGYQILGRKSPSPNEEAK